MLPVLLLSRLKILLGEFSSFLPKLTHLSELFSNEEDKFEFSKTKIKFLTLQYTNYVLEGKEETLPSRAERKREGASERFGLRRRRRREC